MGRLKLALAAALFATGALWASENQTAASAVKVEASKPLAPLLTQAQRELRAIIEKVSPSVVTIFSEKETKVSLFPPGFEDFWKLIPPEIRPYFPPFGGQRSRKETAIGSGFMFKVDDEWVYVLTNHHVVAEAERVTVKVGRLKKVRAEVVGTDPQTDLAVLRIPRKEVKDAERRLAELGDSSKVKVGDFVVAIGNPYGLENTATFGIVSALHRRIGLDQYENFIQTQAPINPGNSGGPLVNVEGEVIGINTAIISQAQGLGFAIPINLAKWVAEQLIEHGRVVRGWLGVVVQELTPAVAEALGLDHGVIVLKVVPGSPADRAGLKPGDIILEVNGKPVRDATQLQFEVMKTPPGTELKLTVLRGEKKLELTAVVGEMPSPRELKRMEEIYYNLGLVLRNATEEDLKQFDAPYGVVVETVYPGSPAYEAGLRPGVLIERVNNRPVRSVEEFRKVVSELAAQKKPIVLWVKNFRGELQIVTIENY
ncbi:MAG: Do family serine endopeptidase [Aquificae bacterium]|nr:Do family serine endopeptidase [Aquificota bacterium]